MLCISFCDFFLDLPQMLHSRPMFCYHHTHLTLTHTRTHTHTNMGVCDVSGTIILKGILRIWCRVVHLWLTVGTSGRLFWTWQLGFEFHARCAYVYVIYLILILIHIIFCPLQDFMTNSVSIIFWRIILLYEASSLSVSFVTHFLSVCPEKLLIRRELLFEGIKIDLYMLRC